MKSTFFLSKKFFNVLLGILVLGFCFSCQNDLLQTENAADPEASALKSAKTTNFMVITNSETVPKGFEAQLSAFGEIVSSMPEIGIAVVKPTTPNFEKKIAKLAGVKAVVPDIKMKWIEPVKFIKQANPSSIGSDEPFFGYQWGMDAINAPEAWNTGVKGAGARVFILDNGIDAEHPDLAPNLKTELCTSFVPNEDYNVDDLDENGDALYFNHGTHVAGIVAAANNEFGVIGAAPEVELVAVKVLSEYDGSGDFSWIISGIVYAAMNGADVINMSLGATFARNGFYIDENGELQKVPASYIQEIIIASQRAVDYAVKKGAVVVVSAGNGGSNFDGNAFIYKLPAELNNVIAVSATAPYNWYFDYLVENPNPEYDIPASYTDFGKSLVDIAAPGGDFDSNNDDIWFFDMVLSTIPGGWSWAAGTSMAAPHVAGVAALIIAKNEGKITPQEVTKQLLKTADKIDGNGKSAFFGKGRVNAYRAVTE
jgi:subtilisin family serine protease